MRAPDRGLSHPAPLLLRVLPRPGLVSGDCDLQGLPWSQSRCWKDRRRLQKIPTLSMVSQTTSRLLCIRQNYRHEPNSIKLWAACFICCTDTSWYKLASSQEVELRK
ncbi:protein dpy-30 homolog isoform X1 [Camelus dromedarius]|uniref:Protein dpy-30 homolog isoform X1 n=2 Tax=Camelus TaxID=9836 RepID=A0A8B8UF44_CAMFR|nr:protein dpy-30 homolog isoform X1 [Camelus dromedarius]XP_032353209.1 protein dpy-30 homolog isoform X1 [Camelus ferus]XP_032353210.1 protein dpy-30 homolog isoform X1 [Camelus ferus]XP_045360780.1 protein dpy-30 homolog isoform X1 [Camelus bactrianus]XP_045360781.1 protein dpy-30 homolog isoform X1 [Camelus bactrianus]